MRTIRSLTFLGAAAAGMSLVSAKCPLGQSYVTVKVLSASLSRCTDSTTDPDTYVTVTVLDDTIKGLFPMRTKIVGNEADPEYNQKLEFGCVSNDAPIVFQVKDHDFSGEEPCMGPIEVQGWPASGEEQEVCATAPALFLGAPSDCLTYAISYVPGTEEATSPDTVTDGEAAAAGLFPPAEDIDSGMDTPLPAEEPVETPLPAEEPIEIIPEPMPVDEPFTDPSTNTDPALSDPVISVDPITSDITITDPAEDLENPFLEEPLVDPVEASQPALDPVDEDSRRHPVDPIMDPTPHDGEDVVVDEPSTPPSSDDSNNVVIDEPVISQPALGKDGQGSHADIESRAPQPKVEEPAPATGSSTRRQGLKGPQLAGAISGSLIAITVLAAAAFTAFFLTRRSRHYNLQVNDDVPRTPVMNLGEGSNGHVL